MGIVESIPVEQIGFKLRRPCAECPFKRTTKIHEGIFANLMNYWGRYEQNNLAQSCHCTDPRSDYPPAKRYYGEVQHCAGLMIMLNREGNPSFGMELAEARGRLDYSKLVDDPDVFDSFKDMIIHYGKHADEMRQVIRERDAKKNPKT